MNKSLRKVIYCATNESIESVISGLDINQHDKVLSVCGSGDIPFAILENSPQKIVVVDENEAQLAYFKRRIDALKNHKYRKFLDPPSPLQLIPFFYKKWLYGITDPPALEHRMMRAKYFKENNRLQKISKNLPNIEIVVGDVFSVDTPEKFSKVYISNARPGLNGYYDNIKKYLLPGALVYSSSDLFQPSNLDMDHEMTKKANNPVDGKKSVRYPVWHPIVYKYITA